jgi:uncharacterized protein (UPF0261 family)
MTKKPNIVVAGILDTKGTEIRFLADRVCAAGGNPIILEMSVGKEVGWADISLSEVVAKVGRSTSEIFALERAKASEVIVEGAIRVLAELLKHGRLDGIIAMGGSMGTSMATQAMQKLPVGVPKLMLSTMASGDVRPYVGTKDIGMLYPIAESGLNVVTRKILNNAAGAIVGMVTTPCVLRASKYFEDRGKYDVMINHAVGTGGRSMEELILDGYIVGMLDITTHEITDLLLGGVLSAGPDRLTAAGRMGIPQVVSTGGLDMINFGPAATVPQKYTEELDTPGRVVHVHNPTVTIVGTSLDEAFLTGKHIASKLNQATGPTALCVPLRGWGAYDTPGPNPDLGWAEESPAPCWVADPEKPEWSLRAERFIDALREVIDRDKPNLDVLLVDQHMNEPEFADLMAELLDEMLSGTWKKGSHHNIPEFIPF